MDLWHLMALSLALSWWCGRGPTDPVARRVVGTWWLVGADYTAELSFDHDGHFTEQTGGALAGRRRGDWHIENGDTLVEVLNGDEQHPVRVKIDVSDTKLVLRLPDGEVKYDRH